MIKARPDFIVWLQMELPVFYKLARLVRVAVASFDISIIEPHCHWAKTACSSILLVSMLSIQGCAPEPVFRKPAITERFNRGSISSGPPLTPVKSTQSALARNRGKLEIATELWLKRFSTNEPDISSAVADYAGATVNDSFALPLPLPGQVTPLAKPDDVAAVPNQSPDIELFDVKAIKAPTDALLYSLASDAGKQLQINGQLDTYLTVNATQQPLTELLRLFSEQADFSWQLLADKIMVWTGEAYGQSYAVNYLNMDRRTQSSVGLATQVGTINAADSTSSTIANSSQTQIENSSEHLFWDSLKLDIEGLVQQDKGVASQANGNSIGRFSINREAGLLTLFAIPSVHRSLVQYLDLLHSNTQRQVLIEATVVEVALSGSFEAGVDWQVLANGINGLNAAQVLVGAPSVTAQNLGRVTAPAGLISLVQQGSNGDVSATLSLLEQFGDVRILSRPRIIALNNQPSVLKVVDNRVYFTLNVQRRQSDDKDEVITETEIHTVPVGLVMNVTPQISQQGDVILNVRPSLSRILGFVNDPNPELAQANVRNGVPEIQVRELESMLQVRSGNVAIIGGLMQESRTDTDAGLPGLSRIPVLGRLFSKQSSQTRQTELLVVLRPTVLSDQSMAGNR